MKKYNSRNEVPEKYRWDLTSFFKDEEDYAQSFKETEELISKLETFKGCTEDANRLEEFLKLEIAAVSQWENLYVYASLVNDELLGNSSHIERKNKTENLGALLTHNTSFFAPELLGLSPSAYAKLFTDNPHLEAYRHELDTIYREKAHILNEHEESIIADLINSMDHFADMSSTLLNGEHDYGRVNVDGQRETITPTNYRRLLKNKDRQFRKKVYNAYNKVIDRYGSTSASYLNAYISMQNTDAKIHKYASSWEASLFSHNMPNEVYETLVKTTEEHVASLQRYFELKRQILGLKDLHGYDLSLELVDDSKEYSIEEAQSLIKEALKPLGMEYGHAIDKIIDKRYIDYCQYPGKCSGGYSFATLDQDSRILLSFNGDLSSVSTIAHEMGHNVHHQWVSSHNPLHYRDVSSLVSEVASLTNECLLSSFLANHGATLNERLAGIANILDVIVSNLFGAVREGKMEQDMYDYVQKGGIITKEYMDNLTVSSLKKYYGSKLTLDKYSKNSWVSRSHYYMHFYLYSYALCISIATFVADGILKGDKELLSRYLKFLQAGSNVWPIDAFAILGIDLTSKEVYEGAIHYFDELVANLASLTGHEEE